MGGRLSRPKGVDGMSEGPTRVAARSIRDPRMLMAPIAAFTMAGLVFLYTRSSIRAAKLEVEERRRRGGGQIDWAQESQRQHGQAEQIDGIAIAKEAILGRKIGSNSNSNKSEAGGDGEKEQR